MTGTKVCSRGTHSLQRRTEYQVYTFFPVDSHLLFLIWVILVKTYS